MKIQYTVFLLFGLLSTQKNMLYDWNCMKRRKMFRAPGKLQIMANNGDWTAVTESNICGVKPPFLFLYNYQKIFLLLSQLAAISISLL